MSGSGIIRDQRWPSRRRFIPGENCGLGDDEVAKLDEWVERELERDE